MNGWSGWVSDLYDADIDWPNVAEEIQDVGRISYTQSGRCLPRHYGTC